MSNGTTYHLWRIDNARTERTEPRTIDPEPKDLGTYYWGPFEPEQAKPAGYMALEDGPVSAWEDALRKAARPPPVLLGVTLSGQWELWRDNSSEYTEAMPFDRPGSYVRIDGLGTSFAWSIWLEGAPVSAGIGSRADAIAAAVELGAVVA